MKISLTKSILFSALLGFGINQLAAADPASDAEQIFNLAEQNFGQYFSPPLNTQNAPTEWPYFRGAYSNNIYAGINADGYVYVAGGDFGNIPLRAGTVQDVLALLQNIDNNEGPADTACNTADVPDYINYSQNGNVVNVSTDGCPAIPEKQPNLCESNVSGTPEETGISVLSDTDTLFFEIKGLSSTDFDLDDFLPNSYGSTTACIIHAPDDFAPLTVNSDICFDVTAQYSQFSSIPGITITPPVTIEFRSTQTNVVVPDCFNTGADTIINLVTNQAWTLQNGNYVLINP